MDYFGREVYDEFREFYPKNERKKLDKMTVATKLNITETGGNL